MAEYADIEFTDAEDEHGIERDCVIATCHASGESTEPVWGHSGRSVRRALAELSENCSCGARFHKAAGEEDEEDD